MRKDIFKGRLVVGRVLQLDAAKRCTWGTEVESSVDKRIGDERVFVIAEVIDEIINSGRILRCIACQSISGFSCID